MLTEPQSSRINSAPYQERLDPGHKVSQSFVCDKFLRKQSGNLEEKKHYVTLCYFFDSISDLAPGDRFAIHLVAGGVQKEFCSGNRFEFGMGFFGGVAEVLDFGHGKLADTDQAGPGRDFIPKCTA